MWWHPSHPHTSSIRRLLLPKPISPLLPLSAEPEVSEWPGQGLPCDERRTQGLQYCWSSLYPHWWTQHSHTMPCCSTPADLFHSPPLLPLLPFSDVRARCLLRKTLFSSSVIGRKSVVNTKTQIVLELTVILNVTFQMCLSINCVFLLKTWLINACKIKYQRHYQQSKIHDMFSHLSVYHQ